MSVHFLTGNIQPVLFFLQPCQRSHPLLCRISRKSAFIMSVVGPSLLSPIEGSHTTSLKWQPTKKCWLGFNKRSSIKISHRFSAQFYTRCAWAEGTCASFPDFCNNRQFHVIYCVYLSFMLLYFEEFLIHDLCGFVILKNNWLNLLGLC